MDSRALQAVVGADADLQLLDLAIVAVGCRSQLGRQSAIATGQLLDPVGLGEDREALDQDLGRLAKRSRGLNRAVGLDLERELVKVGPLTDARGVDLIGSAPNRREDRIDRGNPDCLSPGLVVLGRLIAPPAADRQIHLELRLLFERCDRRLGIQDLNPGRQVDVARGHAAGPICDQWHLDLVGVGYKADDEVFQVEDDVSHVLGDPGDRGELM